MKLNFETFLIRLSENSSKDTVLSVLSVIEFYGGNVYGVLDGTAILCAIDDSKIDYLRTLPSVKIVDGFYINKKKLSKRKRLLKL